MSILDMSGKLEEGPTIPISLSTIDEAAVMQLPDEQLYKIIAEENRRIARVILNLMNR